MGSNVASVCQRHNKSTGVYKAYRIEKTHYLCAFYKSRCAFCVFFYTCIKCVWHYFLWVLFKIKAFPASRNAMLLLTMSVMVKLVKYTTNYRFAATGVYECVLLFE